MGKQPEIRVLNCFRYGDCLTLAARASRIFDCEGCRQFSKWKELQTAPVLSEPQKEVKEMEETKQCSVCKKTLPLNDQVFSKNRSTPDGWERFCKDCSRKRAAKYRKKARGKISQNIPKRLRTVRVKSPLTGAVLPPPPLSLRIDDTILLDQQLLKAVKRSVAKDIIKLIEGAFA